MRSDHETRRRAMHCHPLRRRLDFFLWAGILLSLGFSGMVRAEWTGVALELSDTKSDWEFSNGVREAKITSLSLQIEERTASGLAVGGAIGYMTIRVDGNDQVDTKKFDGENLEIYLRKEFAMSESTSLQMLFNYGYYTGDENTSSDRDDISWNQLGLEFGASFQRDNIRLIPFISYTDVDGDISGEDPTETFVLDDETGYGLRVDVFTESTAFIRLQLQTGSHTGGYLSFVRRY